jgi:hypothetical protein
MDVYFPPLVWALWWQDVEDLSFGFYYLKHLLGPFYLFIYLFIQKLEHTLLHYQDFIFSCIFHQIISQIICWLLLSSFAFLVAFFLLWYSLFFSKIGRVKIWTSSKLCLGCAFSFLPFGFVEDLPKHWELGWV